MGHRVVTARTVDGARRGLPALPSGAAMVRHTSNQSGEGGVCVPSGG